MSEKLEEITALEFVKDKEKAQKEVDALRQGNINKIKALHTYGATIDPALLANMKIDMFIDSFLDDDAKLVYRRNLEMRLREALDEGLAQARTNQIVEGVKANKNLILPK